ncbi:MAG: hypothetical protein P1R58_06805 [bacterium]|nr:hypothetical protein [bacterium]
MKRQLPLALVFVFGLFMVFQYFVPHESSEWVYEFLLDWILIIGIFAVALGIWSLFRVAVDKIKTHKPNWGYSYLTLLGLFSMVVFGFTALNGESWGWYFPFAISALMAIMMIAQTMATTSQKGLYAGLTGLFALIAVVIAIFDPAWSFHFSTAEGVENPMFRAFFDHILIPCLSTMFALLAFFIASAAYRAFRARNLLASLLLIAALIVMLRFNPWLAAVYGDFGARLSNWLMNVPNMAAQRAIVIGVGLGIVATALKVILGIERGYMGKG